LFSQRNLDRPAGREKVVFDHHFLSRQLEFYRQSQRGALSAAPVITPPLLLLRVAAENQADLRAQIKEN
jgi:hypothetical protein